MPLPNLPLFPSDDTQHIETERYRHYLSRFRAELEGQEQGVPNLVEQGQLWGVFPPPSGNLIIDPSFELNRGSWLLPTGAVYFEDTAALSGNYVLRMVSASGYAAGFLIANAGAFTPCVPNQLIGLLGSVRGATSATGTAVATIQFYDAAKAILSTVNGTGVALSTSWQQVIAKAIAPADGVYVRMGFSITSLSGAADWDDVISVPIPAQNEVSEATGTVNFSSTTETVIAAITMGPLAQVGLGGTASVQTPVMITANCAFTAITGAGANVTFRIRRTDVSGTVLATFANLEGRSTLYGTAFDTAPNVAAQTWVLTAQMADATGGSTSQHRMWASQHYL